LLRPTRPRKRLLKSRKGWKWRRKRLRGQRRDYRKRRRGKRRLYRGLLGSKRHW
jgi:hypothetical protein